MDIDDGHNPATLVVESTDRGVSARGEIDTRTAPRLRMALYDLLTGRPEHAPPPDEALVDLTHVPFMASAGIAVLLDGRRLAQERGRTLRVRVVPDGAVAQVLGRVGLDATLNVEPAI